MFISGFNSLKNFITLAVSFGCDAVTLGTMAASIALTICGIPIELKNQCYRKLA